MFKIIHNIFIRNSIPNQVLKINNPVYSKFIKCYFGSKSKIILNKVNNEMESNTRLGKNSENPIQQPHGQFKRIKFTERKNNLEENKEKKIVRIKFKQNTENIQEHPQNSQENKKMKEKEGKVGSSIESNQSKQDEAKPGFKNKNKRNNSFPGMEDKLKEILTFKDQFSKVPPININKDDDTHETDNTEKDIYYKICNKLKTSKIREKGSEYLLDLLLALYKETTNYSSYSGEKTIEGYADKFNFENNKKIVEKVKIMFSRNEIIDALNLVFRHLPNLKEASYEKLFNLLTKIKYKDFESWKKVLRQYLLYLSLMNSNYQPLKFNYIAIILSYLRINYSMLTFSSDPELEIMIEKSIKKSNEYLITNIKKANSKEVTIIVNSLSKLGLLDENNSKIIENHLSPMIRELNDSDFTNILYCFFRNKLASEKFYNLLTKRSQQIIMNNVGPNLNSFLSSQIAKCKINFKIAYYVGLNNNKQIFSLLEKNFLDNANYYLAHDAVSLAHSLVCMETCSEEFCYKIDQYLNNFETPEKLTEMIVFQINYIFMVRKEFSIKNIIKYFDAYRYFLDTNRVKMKQAKVLNKLIQYKIQANKMNEEMVSVLNGHIQILSLYIQKMNK